MQVNLQTALHSTFGFETFRPGQEAALSSLLAGEHTLVVMPTGSGKSLIYQLAALQLPGVTLVISPLIALMKDQVDGLKQRGVAATFINSALAPGEQNERLINLANGVYQLAYVAPERLRSGPFLRALGGARLSLLAVDEAHCISEWGHDFRPDYLHLAEFRHQLGAPLTAALTATATPQVQDDIVRQLDLGQAQRIVTGFNRPNLSFAAQFTRTPDAKLRRLRSLVGDIPAGAVIVYTGTRRQTEETAAFLQQTLGASVAAYHAGLEAPQRTRIQNAFMQGDLRFIVATNAFGMGIDRADVRAVVHYALPSTLEAYYQEAGRAGRDGAPAQAVLLYGLQDYKLQEWFINNSVPTRADLQALYAALDRQFQTAGARPIRFTLEALAGAHGLDPQKARLGLAYLESAGALERLHNAGWDLSVQQAQWRPGAVATAAAQAEAQRALRRRQLEKMIAYAETRQCRRRMLLDHFADRSPAEAPACCDNCQTQRPVRPPGPAAQPQPGAPNLTETQWIILQALQAQGCNVGRSGLAKILWGSTSHGLIKANPEANPWYGALENQTRKGITAQVDALLEAGYIESTGGLYPYVRLSPRGQAALQGADLAPPAARPATPHVESKPALSQDHIRQVILFALQAQAKPLGRTGLMKVLQGKLDDGLTHYQGGQPNPYTGALERLTQKAILAQIDALIDRGLIDKTGDNRPTIQLTSAGRQAAQREKAESGINPNG